MEMDVETAGFAYDYAGWTYLFCSNECMEIFVQAPRECVLYLAHSRSGHLGYTCERQRSEREWLRTWDKTEVKGLFR
jgi:YHS domain-containing protein